MRMPKLVNVKPVAQGLGETHCIAGRVDRILDQQSCHSRPLSDAAGKFKSFVFEFAAREDLGHHAEVVGLLGIDRITGQQKFFGLARPNSHGCA